MVNSPSYATAVGLLRYGMEKELSGQKKFTTHDDTQIFVGLIERMKKWFSEVF
jgi:cell division protein FtsA